MRRRKGFQLVIAIGNTIGNQGAKRRSIGSTHVIEPTHADLDDRLSRSRP
jgi:hypothetical protein